MKYLNRTIIMLPLLMVACLEVKTTTRVNPDGSIHRRVQLKGSADDIETSNFNIPRHDLDQWQVTLDSLGQETWLYKASRNFESVDDLNQSFKLDVLEPGVQIEASLELDEGFFYRRYHYQEQIWADLPGPELPLEAYVSQSELEKFLTSETDSDEGLIDSVELARIENRLDDYLQSVIYQDFVGVLREAGRRSGNLEIVDEVIRENGDSLSEALGLTNFYNENLVWKSILGEYLPGQLVDEIQAANKDGLMSFYQRWQFFEEVVMDDYEFSVELPGVIRETSASDVRGNRLTWDPEQIRVFFGGIHLSGSSSVVKPWSLVFTGLLLLITLVVTVAGVIRQRGRKRAV